jgi:hypothetical protein
MLQIKLFEIVCSLRLQVREIDRFISDVYPLTNDMHVATSFPSHETQSLGALNLASPSCSSIFLTASQTPSQRHGLTLCAGSS